MTLNFEETFVVCMQTFLTDESAIPFLGSLLDYDYNYFKIKNEEMDPARGKK